MLQRARRSLGSARVSRAGERVLAIADFSRQSRSPPSNESQGKACFGATPKPTRGTRALHLHDVRFLVLEMIIDRFNEAIGEFLHFFLHIAKTIFG